MPENYIHIVSFDIPYPPNYGGIIDIYYKIKALKEEGVKVILHCFEYGREERKELKQVCEKVFYYKRNISKKYLFDTLPYIVVSRSAPELVKNLQKDKYPILFEGLHSCFFLDDPKLKERKKVVRSHNIEHDYYENLGKVEHNIFKRYYFFNEAAKLKSYESVMKKASAIAAISLNDTNALSKRYNNVFHVTAFHPFEKIEVQVKKGNFALYHGNLGVGENNEAAIYLIKEIFNDLRIPLVIAGNNPSEELEAAAKTGKNITIKKDISTEEIHELIRTAQINILPTFQSTGIKLKLLVALYTGKHCIVNTPMVENTGLESLCHICDSTKKMKREVVRLSKKSFAMDELKKREQILKKEFSNQVNVKKLIRLLF